MRFTLSEDQQEIKRTARDLLTARSTWEKVRTNAEAARYDDALWKELCELGWPGIAVSEEHGGQGLGVLAHALPRRARAEQVARRALDVALVFGQVEPHRYRFPARGRPRTRSATMFLRISVVPPSIELPRARSSS